MCKKCDSDSPLEVARQIEEAVRGFCADYWNGMANQNEYIVIAQRDGIQAALELLEEMARAIND